MFARFRSVGTKPFYLEAIPASRARRCRTIGSAETESALRTAGIANPGPSTRPDPRRGSMRSRVGAAHSVLCCEIGQRFRRCCHEKEIEGPDAQVLSVRPNDRPRRKRELRERRLFFPRERSIRWPSAQRIFCRHASTIHSRLSSAIGERYCPSACAEYLRIIGPPCSSSVASAYTFSDTP